MRVTTSMLCIHIYTSLFVWCHIGMLLSQIPHISTSVTPLKVCSLFPTAVIRWLFSSSLFLLLSLYLGLYLCVRRFLLFTLVIIPEPPSLSHIFEESGAARGSTLMNRAISIIYHSFTTTNTINPLLNSYNHSQQMDCCNSNIILSIIWYLRRK